MPVLTLVVDDQNDRTLRTQRFKLRFRKPRRTPQSAVHDEWPMFPLSEEPSPEMVPTERASSDGEYRGFNCDLHQDLMRHDGA